MSDPRLDYLETVHEQFDATQKIVNAARLLELGGPEKIKEVADNDPEIIIQAISMLTDIIKQQQADILSHIEARFEMYDELDKIRPKE